MVDGVKGLAEVNEYTQDVVSLFERLCDVVNRVVKSMRE